MSRAIGLILLVGCVVGLVSLPHPVGACAVVWPKNKPVSIASESAIIVWDASSKTEHFIRRASFSTTAEYFGFLVPTPGKPTLSETDDDTFAPGQDHGPESCDDETAIGGRLLPGLRRREAGCDCRESHSGSTRGGKKHSGARLCHPRRQGFPGSQRLVANQQLPELSRPGRVGEAVSRRGLGHHGFQIFLDKPRPEQRRHQGGTHDVRNRKARLPVQGTASGVRGSTEQCLANPAGCYASIF